MDATLTSWQTLIPAKRAEHGLSQAALARAIGVSRQAVTRWETGGWPRPEHVGPLVAALGITDAEVFAIYQRGPDPKAAA